ncbi:hypothetical protein OAS39_08540 [Pirellulales bacterium]|nr:hypothetical protein [Pirellulales bacterium]
MPATVGGSPGAAHRGAAVALRIGVERPGRSDFGLAPADWQQVNIMHANVKFSHGSELTFWF